MIHVITAAFCPAAQLARMLLEFLSPNETEIGRHIIVDCHYPIKHDKNHQDIKLVVESFNLAFTEGFCVELWDPGEDLGSAQSQNWALDKLAEEGYAPKYFINFDPDASCRNRNWIKDAKKVMDHDQNLAVVSCNAPMVQRFFETRHQQIQEKEIDGVKLLLPDIPTPFNLSMWRYSFIRDIGGIPQKFPHYGEVEGPVFAMSRALGFYNAYLKDYMENEDGKLMHDKAFEKWKDAHARENTFLGNFKEYCDLNNLLGE